MSWPQICIDTFSSEKKKNRNALSVLKASQCVGLSDWQMKLSVHKCFVMHLRSDCYSTTYSIDNFVLPATSVANDLVVSIDAKLRFSAHYSQIVKKASRSVRT